MTTSPVSRLFLLLALVTGLLSGQTADIQIIGPWGQLETTRIVIEPPDDLVQLPAPPREQVVWFFGDYTASQLTTLFDGLDLTSDQRDYLTDKSNWSFIPAGIEVYARRGLLLGLSPETRRVLYGVLAQFERNGSHYGPFSFRAEDPADWFANSGLQSETVARVQPLLYRRGPSWLFSDLALVLPDIPDSAERSLLIKTLSRTTTQLVKLRVFPDSDLAALTAYWSGGSRARDIDPLLRSLPKIPGGFTLDITHLLPSFARSRLYTYPTRDSGDGTRFVDCHWTALNFNRPAIDHRFEQIEAVRAAYSSEYYIADDEPVLGDIFLLMQSDGSARHAYVHIAGDIVFTKNGANATSPWILMKLADLLGTYPSDSELVIRHLRARPNAPPTPLSPD